MRRWIVPVVLSLLVILAAGPLWWFPAPFYYFDDGFLHLFRVFEFDRVLREGVVYPRWAPDLEYGYGYPLFNFYPPLAFYATELLHLCGLRIADAIKMTLVVIITIGVSGAYALGAGLSAKAKHSVAAGLLTSVAYIFFPYFLIDLYTRGAIAEGFAAAFLPWLIWSIKRVLHSRSAGSIALEGMFAALFVLSHNLTAFLAAPILVAYVLVEALHLPVAERFKGMGLAVAAALLGALLSAIYWLPLLIEVPLVAISRLSKQLANIVGYSFLAPTDVIQFSLPYQYHEAPFPLAIVPIGLGCLSLCIAIIVRRKFARLGSLVFFASIALIGVGMMTDLTRDVWLGFPLLKSVQFPWRVSIFIGLAIAILVGSFPHFAIPSSWFDRFRLRWPNLNDVSPFVICGLISGLLIWVGLANLVPYRLNNPRGEVTLAQLARFEVNSRSGGLGTMGEYLPLTVAALPSRLNPVILSRPNPTIKLEEYNAAQRSFAVSAAEPVSVSLHAFYFPDWQATIDGKAARAYPSTPFGLLTLDVPAGEHRVEISLVDTLARKLGTILSGLGLLFLGILIAMAVKQREPEVGRIVLAAAIPVLGILPATGLAMTSRMPALQPMQVPVSSDLRLIGLRLEDTKYDSSVWKIDGSSDSLRVQAYWHVQRSLEDKPISWRIADESGKVWATFGQLPRYAAGYAATWVPDEIVEDHYNIPLGAMPRGRYTLQVANGDEKGSYAAISVIELVKDNTPPFADQQITRRVSARVGESVHFLGYDIALPPRPGQLMPCTLYWKIDHSIPEELTGFVHLLKNLEGNLVAQQDGLTDDGFYPTTLWAPGRTIPDRRDLSIPANIKPGLYRLVAGLYHFENLERLPVIDDQGIRSADDVVELGEIKVPMNAKEVRPSRQLDVGLGAAIHLLGYDVKTARDQVELSLYWQAREKVDADYKVFVHVVDATGNLVAQEDHFPGEGRYPTHIWDAGELVVDAYAIALPNLPTGRYQIRIGMYETGSGERLIVTDKAGAELPDRQIVIEFNPSSSGQ